MSSYGTWRASGTPGSATTPMEFMVDDMFGEPSKVYSSIPATSPKACLCLQSFNCPTNITTQILQVTIDFKRTLRIHSVRLERPRGSSNETFYRFKNIEVTICCNSLFAIGIEVLSCSHRSMY